MKQDLTPASILRCLTRTFARSEGDGLAFDASKRRLGRTIAYALLPLPLLLSATATATAQTYTPYRSPYTVQPLSDADLLAEQVRTLTVNPQDVTALIRAGELALKLGDKTAAAAFFARAGRVDPRNPRIKAGEGSLLVAAERPGEALRRFAEAETLGGDPRQFAADRGLAYDLIGENERAQRDYRVALRGGANDETLRRYALSLGIAGKRELALTQIDTLLRRSDRGAWRARAFILAMNGDGSAAERIATSMMPGGLAQGLRPFFAILPTLPAADRAFAVHFGEVRATPERTFDRRLTPPLAVLGPDPTAPVAVAAIARPAGPAREDRRSRRRERDRERVVLAVTTPPPVPLPRPPAYRPGATTAAPIQLASAALPLRPVARPVAPVASATVPSIGSQLAGTRAPVVAVPAARPAIARAAPAAPPLSLVTAAPPFATLPAAVPPLSPVTVAPPPATVSFAAPPETPAAALPRVSGPVLPGFAPVPVAVQAAPSPTPAPVRSEDSILSSILSDLVVPASELDAGPVRPAPVRAAKPKPETPDPDVAARAAADRKAADKKLADKKLADKKAADKKTAEAKAAAEAKKHDPKLLEPSRIWVQVAGGATESDLTKAWSAARAKAPAAFKGKAAWTTPLRATNRVLAGPFKSSAEAQGFVNTIARDGVSGFVFTSTAGQKIDKLPAK